MTKRIVSFCSDLIASSGPLPAEELARRVREAGLTRTANPVNTIRSSLRQSPVIVHLPDGRFDSARRMLDGSVLTHRVRCATKGRQVLFAGPELAVLDQILVHEGSLALSAGGAVTSSLGEFDGWCGPPGWLPEAPTDALLGFRLRNGRVTVETLAGEPDPGSKEVQRLRKVLRRHLQSDDKLDQWHSHHTLGQVMLRALAEVPELLTEPLPPLNEVLRLGEDRWARDWPVQSVVGPGSGQRVVLDDAPAPLVAALERDAARLGVTPGELAVLLLSAATYRTAVPCRHDAVNSWLQEPAPPELDKPPQGGAIGDPLGSFTSPNLFRSDGSWVFPDPDGFEDYDDDDTDEDDDDEDDYLAEGDDRVDGDDYLDAGGCPNAGVYEGQLVGEGGRR